MKTWITLYFALLTFTANAEASSWRLNEDQHSQYQNWVQQKPPQGVVNTMIRGNFKISKSYTSGDNTTLALFTPLFDQLYNYSLQPKAIFVAAHFTLNQPLSSFKPELFFSQQNIQKLSGAKVKVSEKLSDAIKYRSEKPTSFITPDLICENQTFLLSDEQIKNNPSLYEMSRLTFARELNLTQDKLLVLYQVVDQCNWIFGKSQILTFFIKESESQTRIVSLTFSYLTLDEVLFSVNFISTLNKELGSLPVKILGTVAH